MALERGRRLGPYEILAPAGAGGMGEIYKARDTRLDRTVAVKVLPPHLAANPVLRERFEREARAVSSLNHPHICVLHDIGNDSGIDFMVLEYLEGESLADRLQRGPMPIRDALRAGIQIADALDKAHRRGLIHRDLKPGNIFLTGEGAKLLDFGLARVMGPGDMVTTQAGPARGDSPARSHPLTETGTVVGTFSYMAPEQIEGTEAGTAGDIFSFGLILYEMVTGRRAFPQTTIGSLIAAILREDPRPVAESAPDAPLSLQRLIGSCLAKEPERRLHSAHDLKLFLELIAGGADEADSASAGGAPRRAAAAWIVAGVLAVPLAAGWILAVRSWRGGAEPPPVVRFPIPQPPGTTPSLVRVAADADLAIAPDGGSIVFVAAQERDRLWYRPMDSVDSFPLPGTEGAEDPFWSPDGRHVGFFAGGKLRKVPVPAGTAQTLCEAPDARGAAWTPEGLILVGSRSPGGGIMKVRDSGGALEPVTTVPPGEPEYAHQWPSLLPDGRRFLFLNYTGGRGKRSIRIGSIDGSEATTVMESDYRTYYMAPGYLVHVRGNSLAAQPFSPEDGALTGNPILVTDGVATALVPGLANFAVSPTGVVIWRITDPVVPTQMAWVDREGRTLETVGDAAADVSLSLSGDGALAAVGRIIPGSDTGALVGEIPTDIWVMDLARRVAARATFSPLENDENPVWTPDDQHILFASHRDGPADIYSKSSSGTGDERLIFQSSGASDAGRNGHPIDISPDGRLLLMHVVGADGNLDVAVVPVDGSAPPELFASSRFMEAQAQFSPDGRWVAYTSNESGTLEVYVQPWPATGRKWRISSEGGGQPRWRRDGGEIFYVGSDRGLMAVSVALAPEFKAEPPVFLFRDAFQPTHLNFYGGMANYDVSADGRRFLINRQLETRQQAPVQVLLNWRP